MRNNRQIFAFQRLRSGDQSIDFTLPAPANAWESYDLFT